MEKMNDKHKIVFKFNLALFAYLCIGFIVLLLFEPKSEEKVLWDAVYEAFPVLSIIIAVFLSLLLLLWGTKLFELFWNRLISNLFKLREITFQEALSIILVFTIVFTSL